MFARLFGSWGRKPHDVPDDQLVTRAAFEVTASKTDDFRALVVQRWTEEIWEYHETCCPRDVITAAIWTKFDEMQGEPAPAEESA